MADQPTHGSDPRLAALAAAGARIAAARSAEAALDIAAAEVRTLLAALRCAISLSADGGPGVALERGAIFAPLRDRDGGVSGIIRVWEREVGGFTADDEAILAQLAQILALTLELLRSAGPAGSLRRASQPSDALFPWIVEHAPFIAYIKDPEGRYLYTNPEADRVLRLAPGQLIGKTFHELYGDRLAAPVKEMDRQVLETGVPVIGEIRMPPSAEYEWAMTIKFPIRDETGRIVTIGGFNVDVTAQKRAMLALEESQARRRGEEQRFERIIDLVQEAIWIHDQGTLVFANPAAARLYGAPDAASLIGRNAFDFLHPDDRARAQERTRKMLGDGQSLPTAEMRIIGLDGRTRVAELQAVPFRQGDRLLGVASGRDVTAQRDAEGRLRQAQKMEAVGQLTGGVAHDFNNLLTIIIGALDQDMSRLPPDLVPWIDQAMRAAERGATLIQRLLAFSRRQTLIAGPLDFNRLIDDIDDLLRRTLGEHVEIELRLAADLWPALADASQVENALLNLAINARDAMHGGGTLTVETDNVSFDEDFAAANPGVAPGDYVMLAVSDTGTGMAPEVLKRAFEPFFTTKEVGKGTGLGLAMIYGFARQSRGHVLIYSEAGQGTTVKLYLPRLMSEAAGAGEAVAPHAAGGGGETVLVVEDDANVRKLVLRQLTDLGYQVIEAANGKAALEIIEGGGAIDLLFTDVVMPGGINGRQLAEAARQRRPGLKALFTSGYTEDSILRQGKVESGTRLLSKPYRKRDLAAKIREALEG